MTTDKTIYRFILVDSPELRILKKEAARLKVKLSEKKVLVSKIADPENYYHQDRLDSAPGRRIIKIEGRAIQLVKLLDIWRTQICVPESLRNLLWG